MKDAFKLLTIFMAIVCLFGCKKKTEANIHFIIKFDPLQERLSANGVALPLAAGRAAQTPNVNQIGVECLELTTNGTTALGKGANVFMVPQKGSGTEISTDYDQLKMVKDGDEIAVISTKQLGVGRYEWARLAVAYQNLDILFSMQEVPFAGNFTDERGSFATFLAKNNYIGTHTIATKSETINASKPQGYWAFETKFPSAYASLNRTFNGFSPDSTLSFVNPLHQTSPYPKGACFVTGRFETPLSITGNESQDIYITLTLSTNKSFEWEESILRNGKWDSNAQAHTGQPVVEKVVDVGLRGMRVNIGK